ncbi:tyrosine-type recombinase/integrase [Pseudomonas sp. gcc21]|uniref:tyrosine-type recombinase/integrase n=1 Tax=Pseudomonas sp. gcc21 TaxID=2726989 RepID=UPI001451D49C|nr:site-specific integrase [Pseudomonas sp. gcc21]QJD58180.1 tyrosine-type recombinase/integrase [Pseudomonas sp. gcc21]
MSCAEVQLSEAEIKRQAEGVAGDLRDPRHPGLRLRFRQDRTGASWFLIRAKKWHKVGTWPELSAKAVLGMLPELRARLAADPAAVVGSAQWSTVGELLEWYRARVERDRSLSAKRRSGVASAINCNLEPLLGTVPLREVTREVIDRRLMWPLQERLSLSYVRQNLRILTMAFKQAHRLELIGDNPMASMKFCEFVQARIKPKAARLHSMDAEALLQKLAGIWEQDAAQAMLPLMMLCHGTRVGETRQARWRHISLSDRVWIIPADATKTRTEHVMPLTEQVCALLERYRASLNLRHKDSAFVFPGTPGNAMSEKAASYLFNRISGGEWSSHDLRKLARTGWADLGVDYLIGELLLNHAMGFAAQTYIHTTADDLKLDALKRWHDWLDARGFDAIHGLIDGEKAVCANAA